MQLSLFLVPSILSVLAAAGRCSVVTANTQNKDGTARNAGAVVDAFRLICASLGSTWPLVDFQYSSVQEATYRGVCIWVKQSTGSGDRTEANVPVHWDSKDSEYDGDTCKCEGYPWCV